MMRAAAGSHRPEQRFYSVYVTRITGDIETSMEAWLAPYRKRSHQRGMGRGVPKTLPE